MSVVLRLITALVLCMCIQLDAHAADVATPPTTGTPAAGTPTTAPAPVPEPVKCAMDEAPSKENGVTVCKKVPSCKNKGEIISYDTATQKFMCKKLTECKPNQQPVYINGKNECLDVPDCEKTHQSYVFDGTKYSCK